METRKINIEKLAEIWGLSLNDANDVLERLDSKKWLGGESIDVIKFAGVINNGDANKMHGNNGYFIATADYLCWITNGDPVWEDNTEDNCINAGIDLGNPIN